VPDNWGIMDGWRTAIATSDATGLWVRGYDVTALMKLVNQKNEIVLSHRGTIFMRLRHP